MATIKIIKNMTGTPRWILDHRIGVRLLTDAFNKNSEKWIVINRQFW